MMHPINKASIDQWLSHLPKLGKKRRRLDLQRFSHIAWAKFGGHFLRLSYRALISVVHAMDGNDAVPERPGLGMEPDYELLAQYRSG